MKKLNYIVISLAGAGILGASAVGVANAATKTANPNVGSSGIPRSILKQEHLDAESQVLNTSTTNIQSAYKNKTFSVLITNASLTKKTYNEKLKAQQTSDLEAKGYTQDQITIALQHKVIVHLRRNSK